MKDTMETIKQAINWIFEEPANFFAVGAIVAMIILILKIHG